LVDPFLEKLNIIFGPRAIAGHFSVLKEVIYFFGMLFHVVVL